MIGRDSVKAVFSSGDLGFRIHRVWNPSPSDAHRTEPYPVPQRIRIGVADTPESGARFSPPPFAVVAQGPAGEQALVAVTARPGWHRWNQAVFETTADEISVSLDLEGHTRPRAMLPHLRFEAIPGRSGESSMALLARGLKEGYRAISQFRTVPDWWRRPIYCGWGDQVTTAMWMEGRGPESRALAYCIQGLYERWIRRLEQAGVPLGTVIVDAGWSPAGVWEPDVLRWPDLRGFIARQHEAGRRVLLWVGTWMWEGLPGDWCIHAGRTRLVADPSHPGYRRFIREKVRRLLSPDGYDADGFKIDQLAFCPSERQPCGGPRFGRMASLSPSPRRMRPYGDPWGIELLHLLQKTIYRAAVDAKPDALISSSTVHPYFANTFNMLRLHDMGMQVPDDLMGAMRARADLARAALPGLPVDTDDWIHMDYRRWLDYTRHSAALGVPCLFYAERFMLDWDREPATCPIPFSDLRKIARAWTAHGADACNRF